MHTISRELLKEELEHFTLPFQVQHKLRQFNQLNVHSHEQNVKVHGQFGIQRLQFCFLGIFLFSKPMLDATYSSI